MLFVLSALLAINSCKKGGSGKNNNITTPPAPAVSITKSPLTVLLPNNCTQEFTISNTGPQGTVLNYTVAEDSARSGFLSFSPFEGSIKSGDSVTISVNIKPSSISSKPSLIGSSLVLNVYTPKASNYTKIPVPVYIKSINSIASSFAGTTWGGTWAGKCVGINTNLIVPVGGTWTLNLQSLDTVNMAAIGTLTWNGMDAYLNYVYDNNGAIISVTPSPFVPNRTIKLGYGNAPFSFAAPAHGCSKSEIFLYINETPFSHGDSYGPSVYGYFDIKSGIVDSLNSGFATYPYSPDMTLSGMSTGKIIGKKQ